MNAPLIKKEKIRLDKYLWSIRVFKSRSLATEAIEKGRVKLKGENVKASRNVVIGDIYEARTEHKNWVLKVTQLLDGRLAMQKQSNIMKTLLLLKN